MRAAAARLFVTAGRDRRLRLDGVAGAIADCEERIDGNSSGVIAPQLGAPGVIASQLGACGVGDISARGRDLLRGQTATGRPRSATPQRQT